MFVNMTEIDKSLLGSRLFGAFLINSRDWNVPQGNGCVPPSVLIIYVVNETEFYLLQITLV